MIYLECTSISQYILLPRRYKYIFFLTIYQHILWYTASWRHIVGVHGIWWSCTCIYLLYTMIYLYIIVYSSTSLYNTAATLQWTSQCSGYTIWWARVLFDGLLCFGTTLYGHLVQMVEILRRKSGNVLIPRYTRYFIYILAYTRFVTLWELEHAP